MEIDYETLRRLAAAQGWTLQPAPTQPTSNAEHATSIQPTNTREAALGTQEASTTGQDGTTQLSVAAPPSVPGRIRASAPSRPVAFGRSTPSVQPCPTAASPTSTPPVDPPSATPPTSVLNSTLPPALATTTCTDLGAPRSSSAIRTTSSTRVARRTASGAPIGASANPRPATPVPAASPASTTAPTDLAIYEPTASEISAAETAVLAREVSRIKFRSAPIKIKFIGEEPRRKKGVRQTQVKVEEYLDVDRKMMDTIRSIMKLVLSRTPGVDMRETINNQPIKSSVMRAVKHTAQLIPEFQVYADYDYWPLEIIAARILRTSADNYQKANKRGGDQKLQEDDVEQASTGMDQESKAAPASSAQSWADTPPTSTTSETPQAPLVATESSVPSSIPHAAVSKDSETVDEVIANLTNNFDDMCVEGPAREPNEADEDLGPFTLPADLTGPARPLSLLSRPSASPTCAPPEVPAQPTSPITINSTATSTATSRSISKATSNVTATVAPNPTTTSQPVPTPVPTLAQAATATPRPTRRLQDQVAATPAIYDEIRKLKEMKLTKEQLAHFPESFRAALGLVGDPNDNPMPLERDPGLSASSLGTVARPPPYESDPDNDMDASSGLSEPSEDDKGLRTDPEAMDIDDETGPATKGAKGRKKTKCSSGQAGKGKKPAGGRRGAKATDEGAAPAVAGSSRQPARGGVSPEQQSDQVDQPSRRSTRQNGTQHASGNTGATSAPAAPKKKSYKKK
ncbi:hypothetical protein RhiLY_12658 [Ceratobasidium sp. AG-Ba]|nr:hypothetical protein RhiLY_12658 [Ceratobasidium sp. AG-Ba]